MTRDRGLGRYAGRSRGEQRVRFLPADESSFMWTTKMHDQASLPAFGETERVLLAGAGDRAAFDQLVHHYRPALLALTFLRTRDICEAEDLVQQILVRIWRKLPGLRQPDSFLPWMKSIAANACSTWYRRTERLATSIDMMPACQLLARYDATPLEIVLSGEKQREVHRALLLLPKANRLALLMHVWGSYSYAEIAAFTDVPVTTVEGRIYRAKRQMRSILRDEGAAFLRSGPCHAPSDATKESDHDKPEAE